MGKGTDRFIVVTIILMILAVLVLPAFEAYGTMDHITATVTKTERVTSGDSSYYLIYTEGETFKNTDNILLGKFDSSDLYGKIHPGKYDLKVVGWRIKWLSTYRNVISATPVGD